MSSDTPAADGSQNPAAADPAAADPTGVSFTDTNAETGAGGKGATASTMADLVGALKKSKGGADSSSKDKSSSKASSKSGGKKKGKKAKKGKNKYGRRHDRYESDNYLLRIEGTVCCGAIISGIFFVAYNSVILFFIVIWASGEPDRGCGSSGLEHHHNCREMTDSEKTEAKNG